MSSAANHRARSHQSHHRRMSAMSGAGRRSVLYNANKYGGRGSPFIARLRALRRWVNEQRRKRSEAAAET